MQVCLNKSVNVPTISSLQKGQILPLGVGLLLIGALLTLVLFNTGQLVSEKTRTANTADAAAYSGLVWQARALNFNAYTNRAMVANQVSIAQFVSLSSWSRYGKIKARNINNTVGLIPVVRPFTEVFAQIADIFDQVVGVIANVAVPIIDVVNAILSATQEAAYYSTFVATPTMVQEVVKANDPGFDADSKYALYSMSQNLLEWKDFTRRYDSHEDLSRKADIINRSRDGFTANRDWKIGRFNLGILKVGLYKEGATHLVSDGSTWSWIGNDTISLHRWKFRCSWKGCKWKHSELPIGWGESVSPDIISCGGNCPSWGKMNKRARNFARAEGRSVGGYSGVHSYYDIADISEANDDPRLLLRIEVSSSGNSVDTVDNIDGLGSSKEPTKGTQADGIGVGAFALNDQFASGSIASVASAELFFERPVFNDRDALRVNKRVQDEYGSLWNPYWQVRLADTPREHRLASWAVRSPELINASVRGGLDGGGKYLSDEARQLEDLVDLESYGDELISELPDRIDEREFLNNELEASVSELAQITTDYDSAREGLKQAESQYLRDQLVLNNLNDERSNLQLQLANTTSLPAQRAIEQEIQSLELNIEQARDVYSVSEVAYQNYRQDFERIADVRLRALNESSSIRRRLVDVGDQIESARQLESEINAIRGLERDTRSAIEGYADAAVSDLFGDLGEARRIARVLETGGLVEVAADQIQDYAEERVQQYVEDKVTEQLEEAIKSAATNILASYAGDYDSYVQTAESYADKAEGIIDQVDENAIEPMRQQLQIMKEKYNEAEARFREELNRAQQIMEEDIDFLSAQMSEEVARVREDAQASIDTLVERQLNETDPLIREELQNQIDGLQVRQANEAGRVESAYQAEINALQNSITRNRENFESRINSELGELRDNIVKLENKIASIQQSFRG